MILRKTHSKPPIGISLIIPVYNNEKTATEELQACRKVLSSLVRDYEIIVCEDKSTDSTAEKLARFTKNRHMKLIFHKKNLGLSRTLRELYSKSKYPYIIPYSIDGDWKANDIDKLIKKAISEKADIIIGKRPKKSYPFYRRIVSFLYNFLPLLLFGVNTVDAGSVKVIKRNVLKIDKLKSKSIFFEAEIIIRAKKNGAKILLSPIYYRRRSHSSNAGGDITLIFEAVKDMIKLRLNF